jgi:hypothetical protein
MKGNILKIKKLITNNIKLSSIIRHTTHNFKGMLIFKYGTHIIQKHAKRKVKRNISKNWYYNNHNGNCTNTEANFKDILKKYLVFFHKKIIVTGRLGKMYIGCEISFGKSCLRFIAGSLLLSLIESVILFFSKHINF